MRRTLRRSGQAGATGSARWEEALVAESRARSLRRPEARESLVGTTSALGFVLLALVVAIHWWPNSHISVPACLVSVTALAVASRAEFEIGRGAGVPTQLVFVPMLFLLPTGIAPLLVMAAYVLERMASKAWRTRLRRLHITIGSCWFALGPSLVLCVAGETTPAWEHWPIYAAALLAQISIDLAVNSLSEWFAFHQVPRATAAHVLRANVIDAALAPTALALAIAGQGAVIGALVVALPLILLLRFMAEDRELRLGQANELSQAYEGTAMLLGDVVEADDEYTGSHTRGVVWLVERVTDELRLGLEDRRDAKLAAILHDVGKIRIPDAIINKPGKLTPQERAIIETHTIEGQKLLTRVGGLLAEVGLIVRSCHERWDGQGYPDCIAGEEIPLAARIVCVCDAFNAMITDRPYRPRRTSAEAIAELRRCAGAQFDPRVVAAAITVITEVITTSGSDAALQQGEPKAA